MMTNNKNVEDKSKNKKSIKKDTVRTCSQTLSCLINQVDNINDIQFRFFLIFFNIHIKHPFYF